MDDILELASRLGKRIASDARGQNLANARAALEKSQLDRQLLIDFEDHQHRLLQSQQEGKPIEPEDKRKLVALQDKVTASPVIKNMLKSQADYLELMSNVMSSIEREVLGGNDSAS